MRISTKGRLAVTAMIDLGLCGSAGPVKLADICQRHQISQSYLEQLFSKLRHHALVISLRGPGGGYILGRAPADISVADIVIAVDEPFNSSRRNLQDVWSKGERQLHMPHHLWDALDEKIAEFLGAVSLKQLLEEQTAAMGGSRAKKSVKKQAISDMPPRAFVNPNTPNSVFALGTLAA